jgi:hypothetical protein
MNEEEEGTDLRTPTTFLEVFEKALSSKLRRALYLGSLLETSMLFGSNKRNGVIMVSLVMNMNLLTVSTDWK